MTFLRFGLITSFLFLTACASSTIVLDGDAAGGAADENATPNKGVAGENGSDVAGENGNNVAGESGNHAGQQAPVINLPNTDDDSKPKGADEESEVDLIPTIITGTANLSGAGGSNNGAPNWNPPAWSDYYPYWTGSGYYYQGRYYNYYYNGRYYLSPSDVELARLYDLYWAFLQASATSASGSASSGTR